MIVASDLSASTQISWCESLYRTKAASLVLYGRALGLSHAEAEDVLQETFLALMRRSEAPTNTEYYCLRAYRNRALNYRRSLWRRLAREWESLRWFEQSDPVDEAESRAIHGLVSLPADQREVIVLKVWHERTFEEIGTLLEIPPNTAAGRYRYGMQKIRTLMKGSTYERHERLGEPIALVDAPTSLRQT